MSADAALAELDRVLSALRHSHDRLAAAVAGLGAEQLTGPSYASEWSIAQVLSHIGSGAEIMVGHLHAGQHGEPALGSEQAQPIWDRWDAKDPEQVARDAVSTDAEFLAAIDALSAAQRRDWRLSLFGGERTLSGLGRLRLAEHVLHTWDIVVMREPQAGLASDAAALVVDGLGLLVGYVGKPADQPPRVLVRTDDPQRRFLLAFDADGAQLTPAEPELTVDADLRLPAEAFIRLVYGRLDPGHTPAVTTQHVDLDVLRRAFPGV
jgi:uncharacterized protein (TIGR03083 family)